MQLEIDQCLCPFCLFSIEALLPRIEPTHAAHFSVLRGGCGIGICVYPRLPSFRPNFLWALPPLIPAHPPPRPLKQSVLGRDCRTHRTRSLVDDAQELALLPRAEFPNVIIRIIYM